MKVLGISCGRKLGNCEILLREALTETEILGGETEIIRLGDLAIKPCVGCESCVLNRLKGGDQKCIQKNDHMPFLLDKLAGCDGAILGVPAYMLMPPGLLIMIANRLLGAGKTYAEKITKNPKVGAVITVGGTDWVNLVLPLTTFSLHRLFRGNVKLVDQMLVTRVGRPGQVLLHDEAIVRARKLGHRMVEALKMPYNEVKFFNEEPEACPLCHSNLLKIRGKIVECPICDIKGNIKVDSDGIKIIFDEKELQKSRFSPWGIKRHDDLQKEGLRLYSEGKSDIDEKIKKYRAQKSAIAPPLLKLK